MRIRRNLNKVIVTIFAIAASIALHPVFAQQEENASIGFLDFEWFQIVGPLDLKNFGALKLAGYIVAFIVAWMVFYTLWLIFKVAWMYIRSRGDSGEVEQAGNTGREIFKGVAITFIWMLLYIMTSIFLGVGNLFRWPEALTQCGDGTPYFQAEYNANQLLKENGYSFINTPQYKTSSFCCESIDDIRNGLGSLSNLQEVPDSNSSVPYAYFDSNGDASVVYIELDEDYGGWLFFNAPKTNIEALNLEQNLQTCRTIFN